MITSLALRPGFNCCNSGLQSNTFTSKTLVDKFRYCKDKRDVLFIETKAGCLVKISFTLPES